MSTENEEPEFKFSLGDEAKDAITGFEGVIVCRSQWLHNCNVYSLQPKELKDGKPMDRQSFDEPQLELVKKGAFKESRDTGGPTEAMEVNNR